jgi:hypothetical protein
MALRPVVGFSLAGMASLLTRPFRRAAGAGPLWRRRRSVTQFRGTFRDILAGISAAGRNTCLGGLAPNEFAARSSRTTTRTGSGYE